MSDVEGKKHIIFAGGIFRDLVAYSERFPKVGETIIGTKFQMGFGGKSANQVPLTV
jgi:ribokinase